MAEFIGMAMAYSFMWTFLAWLVCAFFAGHIATEKGRWGFLWFLWGLVLGPLALIAAVGLPDKKLLAAVLAVQGSTGDAELRRLS